MSADDRIEALKTRHADLEERIHKEAVRPNPDEAAVNTMKREKLRIKDEINSLSGH
jgi:hypothetical protein